MDIENVSPESPFFLFAYCAQHILRIWVSNFWKMSVYFRNANAAHLKADTHTSTRLWTCAVHRATCTSGHTVSTERERDVCQEGELKYSRRGEENNSITPPSPSSPWTPASAPPSSRPQKTSAAMETRPKKVNMPALISVRPHRVRIHLHFRWKGWQYKKPSCFWYVRVCNGPGMWERKWQGTPNTPPFLCLSLFAPLPPALGNRWKQSELKMQLSTETWGPNAVTQTFKRDAGSTHY